MSEDGLQSKLAQVTEDGLERVTIGQIESIEANGPHGYFLNCRTRPAGNEVQARPAASGIWVPYNVGDEVELTFPGGDPNRAIARRGLTSTPDPIPADFNNSQPVFTHPQGLELRTANGAGVEKVTLATLLSALDGVLDEVIALGLTGFPAPVPTPNSIALKLAIAAGTHESKALKTQ